MPSSSSQDRQLAAEEISQTIDSQDPDIQLISNDDADDTSDDGQPEPPKPAGYKVADLLNAPIRPPEPEVVEDEAATSNRKVVLIIGGATLLFALGVLLAVVGYLIFGIILFVLAALLVMAGVFLPVR